MLEYSAATRHLRAAAVNSRDTAKARTRRAGKVRRWSRAFALCSLTILAIGASAQAPAPPRALRLAVLQAEDRRAPTPRDLALLRSAAHGGDDIAARSAVRALGRLERPSLIADICRALQHPAAEVRAEAANAVGQAAQGWNVDEPPAAAAVDAASAPLVARLKVEASRTCAPRSARPSGGCRTSRRRRRRAAERMLVERRDARIRSPIDSGLRKASKPSCARSESCGRRATRRSRCCGGWRPLGRDAAAGARIRRLALEALVDVGRRRRDVLGAAAHDPDAQVRRIAMRAAAPQAAPAVVRPRAHAVLAAGRADESPAVRIEALRGLRARERCRRVPSRVEARRRPRRARSRSSPSICSRRAVRSPMRSPRSSTTVDRSVVGRRAARLAPHRARHRRARRRGARARVAALPQFIGSRSLAAPHVRRARRGARCRIARARCTGERRRRQCERSGRRGSAEGGRPRRRRDLHRRPVAQRQSDRPRLGARARRHAARGRGGAGAEGGVAAARRRGPRQLARCARRDRENARRLGVDDAARVARRRRPRARVRCVRAQRRRSPPARVAEGAHHHSAASAPSSSRSSRRRRRPPCCASRASPSPATTTA